MKVILKEDVVSLGIEGNVLEVADGYARNYLIPKGLAVLASPGNLKDLEFRRKAIEKKETARKMSAEEHAKLFEGKKITVHAKVAEEGKLYGSVSTSDVANAIEEQLKETIDKRQIVVQDHIKEVGKYDVIIRLHPEIEVTIELDVLPEDVVEAPEEKAETTEAVEAAETEEAPTLTEGEAGVPKEDIVKAEVKEKDQEPETEEIEEEADIKETEETTQEAAEKNET